jgi:hypothetical protein
MSGNLFNRRDALMLAGAGSLMASPVARAAGAALPASGEPMLPMELTFSGGKRAFKMHPRAAILTYPIRFILGAEGNGGGRVGIYLTLGGPTEADMAALAAEAREDLATRLAAIGLPVVPPAEMLAAQAVKELGSVPGSAKWDEGVLDPMGKRLWYMVAPPSAPLLPQWGSTSGSSEFGTTARLPSPSRAVDAVMIAPYLTLEFTTLSGTVKSGSKGSTSWAGGEILFGFKPHSITYFTAGGKRSIENVGGSFQPKGRIVIAPTRLPGQLRNNVAVPSPEMSKRMGNARIDAFDVDMTAWRDWVRLAFRSYNELMARHIAAARA